MDPERAVAALMISGDKEIKHQNEMIDQEGMIVDSTPTLNGRFKKRFSFNSINIPIGAELTFSRDKTKICTIISEGVVQYDGKQFSLSKLADQFLREMGYEWKSVQGPSFFKYGDKTLSELKKEMEESYEDEE